MSMTVSSGHAKYVAGAIGIVKEVEQARKIVDRIAAIAKTAMPVQVFHDDLSRTKKDNLNRIVAFHNRTGSKYHYSVHLNSSGTTVSKDIGVEVLYKYDSDQAHAAALASAIAKTTGLKNRGAKKRTDLAFLCAPRRLLIEAYFVNSGADVQKMDEASEIEKFAYAAVTEMCKVQNIKLPTQSKTTIKEDQKEETEVVQLLNDTGRKEIRELLKKARAAGIIDAAFHTDAKIDKYSDVELLSYMAAVVNREFN